MFWNKRTVVEPVLDFVQCHTLNDHFTGSVRNTFISIEVAVHFCEDVTY